MHTETSEFEPIQAQEGPETRVGSIKNPCELVNKIK